MVEVSTDLIIVKEPIVTLLPCLTYLNIYIFELHKGTIYSFVKFKDESLSSNIERSLEENKHIKG